MRINEIISEAPIQDFKTIGDFSKNSSFRDPRDRHILTHQRTIDIIKKKFDKTDVDFNMYFVNSPKANKHTEVGEVTMEWVEENLGEEVSSQVQHGNDSITVIFTNNKGQNRIVMTPWIIAHRIAHVLFRYRNSNQLLRQSYSAFIRGLAQDVFPAYGYERFPTTFEKFSSDPNAQKILQLFAYEVCTFNSARSRNLTNGFEALHEMFAQYIITGEVKFNDLPRLFGNRNMRLSLKVTEKFEYDDYNHQLHVCAEILGGDFDAMLWGNVNKIFVM